MSQSRAILSTPNGARYLSQLCKHWSHKFPAEFSGSEGRIDLGEGRVCEMTARDGELVVLASAPEETLARLQEIIAAHILRFAHREPELAFDWRPVD